MASKIVWVMVTSGSDRDVWLMGLKIREDESMPNLGETVPHYKSPSIFKRRMYYHTCIGVLGDKTSTMLSVIYLEAGALKLLNTRLQRYAEMIQGAFRQGVLCQRELMRKIADPVLCQEELELTCYRPNRSARALLDAYDCDSEAHSSLVHFLQEAFLLGRQWGQRQ